MDDKPSTSFIWWYRRVLTGAVATERNLRVNIRRESLMAKRIDLGLAILAICGTATTLAAFQKTIPSPDAMSLCGAAINVFAVAAMAIRNYYLTPAKQKEMFNLYERIQDFIAALNQAIATDDVHYAPHNNRRNDLERELLEVAAELAPATGWDDMTDSERQQAIEQSFPA